MLENNNKKLAHPFCEKLILNCYCFNTLHCLSISMNGFLTYFPLEMKYRVRLMKNVLQTAPIRRTSCWEEVYS